MRVGEGVLEPAADAVRVEELAAYVVAYFEGKGLEARARTRSGSGSPTAR